jgi:cytochrome c biogenesis protein CcmG, thiol:disulfide interchange protein DsbE
MPKPSFRDPNAPLRDPTQQRPTWVKRLPLIVFGVLAGLFLYALFYANPQSIPSALIGKPVPPVGFAALDGLKAGEAPVPGLTGTDFAKGRVTVVNFWASWCGPCVVEHPMLVELKNRVGDSADLVGINYKDTPTSALSFLNRKGNPFSRVGTDLAGRGAIDWGVYGIPETFVVNGRGEIAYKHIGEITAESIDQKLLPAIKAALSPSPAAVPN